MGIQVFHDTPQGRVLVNRDVLQVAERLQKGDATCGWSGDERLHVAFNPRSEKYEVWRLCEDGKDRIVSSWRPDEFDARVVMHTAQHDLRRRGESIFDEIDRHNEKVAADRLKEAEIAAAEGQEFLEWAWQKLYMPGQEAPRPHGRALGG